MISRAKILSLAALASLCSSATPLHAAVWDAELEQLTRLAEPAGNPTADAKAKDTQERIQATLALLNANLSSKNYGRALHNLHALGKLSPKLIPASAKLSEKLLKELHSQREEAIKKRKELYQEFAKVLLNAKKPVELDAWIVKLNSLSKANPSPGFQFRPFDPSRQHETPNYLITKEQWELNMSLQSQMGAFTTVTSEARAALNIATYWQNYLHYLTTGNYRNASNAMNQVASSVSNFTYIPRSKVLGLQHQLEVKTNPANKVKAEYNDIETLQKTITDSESAMAAYSVLSTVSDSQLEAPLLTLKGELSQYRDFHRYLTRGSRHSAMEIYSTLHGHPILGKIATKELEDALAKSLKIPPTFQRNDGESPAEWVIRYADDLAKKGKWKALHAVSSASHNGFPRSDTFHHLTGGADAVKHLLIGMNFENHKQWARALAAYRQVMATYPNFEAVTKEAGKRLLALQQAHPNEAVISEALSSYSSTLSYPYYTASGIRELVQKEIARHAKKEAQQGKQEKGE